MLNLAEWMDGRELGDGRRNDDDDDGDIPKWEFYLCANSTEIIIISIWAGKRYCNGNGKTIESPNNFLKIKFFF